MPTWLVSILVSLWKPITIWALGLLETKFPGLKSLIQTILTVLQGGASAAEVESHIKDRFSPSLPGPADLVAP